MIIAHLSDLHFGTHEAGISDYVTAAIARIKPDLAIISGDFTQVATASEFRMAQAFLNSLPCPALCIPGNHDVPRYDLRERFFHPFRPYETFIAPEAEPIYVTPAVVAAGLNTARRALPHWNWANGAVSAGQRDRLRRIFKPDEARWTLLALHHPIHKTAEMPVDVTVFGGRRTMHVIHDLRIDLVLTGHVHHASLTTIGDEHHQTVYLSASTAMSWRRRNDENGFNVITLDDDRMLIEILTLGVDGFVTTQTYEHRRIAV